MIKNITRTLLAGLLCGLGSHAQAGHVARRPIPPGWLG